ncbi:MAG: hypothetical protein FWH05_03310 [Oscillospiraceae bacterium]|nr:hypothetical protein [Oscillospiraceae bacterium]
MGRAGRSGGGSSGGRSGGAGRSGGRVGGVGRSGGSSSSGRSGSSGSSGRSSSSGRSGSSGSWGSFGLGYALGHSRRRHRHHSSYGYGGGGSPRGSHSGGCGVGAVLVVVIVVIFLFFLFSPDDSITRSTVAREPLPPNAAAQTGKLYTDDLHWIGNETVLTNGLENFHKRTGVRPHLYITGDIYGDPDPTPDEVQEFAREKYNELFNDQAHLMFVFFESEASSVTYIMQYHVGSQAATVLDVEAMDILMDYVERNYYSGYMNESELFGNAFDSSSQRIMEVYQSPWVNVWIFALSFGGGLAIIFLLFSWWKRAKAQKNLEAEQTERILGQNLETFESKGADDEASKLAKEYEDK